MSKTWSHLIRFVHDGIQIYGDAIIPKGKCSDDLVNLASSGELFARPILGDDPFANGKVGQRKVAVKELLLPLRQQQVRIIRCIGLNYVKHSMSARS